MNSYDRQKVYERLLKHHKNGKGNCYLWTGNIDIRGYGKTHILGKLFYVHSLAVVFFNDWDLNTKMFVQHNKCKNRNCFNPEHLTVRIQIK